MEDAVTRSHHPARPSPALVRELVRSASVEIIPLRGAEEKVRLLEPGTTVTVTCSARLGLERTLEHVERARAAGYRVVPHLAARQVVDRAGLRSFVGRVAAVGVTDLFVIGGDAAEPAGRYESATALLRELAEMDHPFERIGVACYPEGHPKAPDEALVEALLDKQVYASYLVSQLCFDPNAIVGWLAAARRAGIHLPLRIGLAAPMSTRKLAELSLRIGVGASVRFLGKQHGLVGNLLLGSSYRPRELLGGIGPELLGDPATVEGVHLFSFNQIDATVGWQRGIDGAA
jgi:methylenetetrahydrofolate reductase (NADPH)